MTDRAPRSAASLTVKAAGFTLLVPGTLVLLAPLLLLGASVRAIDLWGVSMLGVLPVVVGGLTYLRSVREFVRVGDGTPAPRDPPRRLVTTGPYRYVRNPMYLGILAVLAGEALVLRHVGLLSFLVALVLGLHLFVLGYEEAVMGRRFGEAYMRYCDAVPRWIPRRAALSTLYRGTFLSVGAFVFFAGAIAHVLRLSVGLPVIETPESLHAFFVVLPGYAGVGCVAYLRRVRLGGVSHRIMFALIIGLLFLTVVMHLYSIVARDNSWYGFFPMWYSVVAGICYGVFAWFLKTRALVPER